MQRLWITLIAPALIALGAQSPPSPQAVVAGGGPAIWDRLALPGGGALGGTPRRGRTVAMFYFLWSCESGRTATRGPTDVSAVLARHPAAAKDPKHPAWGASETGQAGAPDGANAHYHHWGKPLFGYYCSADPWVIDRHMRLLTNAGVDLLVLDATNAEIYANVVAKLQDSLDAIERQRGSAPKLAFYTNTHSARTMMAAYDAFYRPGARARRPGRWFMIDGRPLIIGRGADASPELRRFFTIRESQWPNEPRRACGWPWIEFVRPQPVYRCGGRDEIVNVSVAQHAETVRMSSAPFGEGDRNWGRGYHQGLRDHSPAAIARGANVQEQWDEAIRRNPPIVFVTGWNEWIAGRLFDGKRHFMVDLADAEYSRDIEMREGGWGDAYYLQLARNIARYRRVKGTPSARPCATGETGDARWRPRGPVYRDYIGDIADRRWPGIGGAVLTDRSGRNDLTSARTWCSGDSHFFSATFAGAPTLPLGPTGLRLRIAPAGEIEIERTAAGVRGRWAAPAAALKARVTGRTVTVAVPRARLAVSRIAFGWSDHVRRDATGTGRYASGDAAPDGNLLYLE